MLQFVIVALLVAESYHTTRAMGIGRFARTFPCSKKVCPLSSKLTGCTKTPIQKDMQMERTPITNQSTTDDSNHQPFMSNTLTVTTKQVVQTSKTVLNVSTKNATSKRGSDNATIEYSIPITAPFTPNMAYASNSEGFTKTSILYQRKAEINPTTNQSTPSYSTAELFSSRHDLPKSSTVNQLVQASKSVLEISTNYTTKERSNYRATTEHSISTAKPFRTIMVYANSTEGQGYINTPILSGTQVDIKLPTDQNSTAHSTLEPLTSKQDILETSTTNQVVQSSEPLLQSSTDLFTTKQGSRDRVTTENLIPTTAPCPSNMVYAYCTGRQGTCQDPLGSTETCSESMICVCPDGFLMRGNDCVPQEQCECYTAEFGVIPNGGINVNADCTNRCECHSNVLTCNSYYSCSSDATCEVRKGVRQCYCNVGYTGDGQSCEVEATDCADLYNAGATHSGVYTIKPATWPWSPFQVYCNMTVGGGWTVFQRRFDGSQNFYNGWNMYKNGFGSPDRELWLGNEKLYYMTNSKNYKLRIDLTDKNGSPYYANYDAFRISGETDKYRLVGLGRISGNQGYDALNKHRNSPFSTYDKDNDGILLYNCAYRHRGGWWYDSIKFDDYPECTTGESDCDYWLAGLICGQCASSNLNGDYDSSTRGKNIHWTSLPGYDCNIIYTEMKIKPA